MWVWTPAPPLLTCHPAGRFSPRRDVHLPSGLMATTINGLQWHPWRALVGLAQVHQTWAVPAQRLLSEYDETVSAALVFAGDTAADTSATNE